MSALLFALLPMAQASPSDLYGFGGRTIGRGGAGVALVADPDAALLNPAGLGGVEQAEVGAGFAVVRMNFESLPAVYWDTNQDGRIDEHDPPLEPGPYLDRADGAMLSVARPIVDGWGVGASFFLPRDRLLRFETYEPSIPTYFMYENRPHRYALAVGSGVELGGGLRLGAGLEWMGKAELALGFAVDLGIDGDEIEEGLTEDLTSITIDAQTIRVDLATDVVPAFGIQWHPITPEHPALEDLSVGLTVRAAGGLPVLVDINGQINITAEDIADLEPTAVALLMDLQMNIVEHYLPATIQGGLAYQLGERLQVYTDARRSFWTNMETNVAHVVDASLGAALADLGDLEVQDGNLFSVDFRDTWSVRGGMELTMPSTRLPGKLGQMRMHARAGAGYEQTPLLILSQSAKTALLDADRILVAGGLGAEHRSPLTLIEGPFRWDAFAQMHMLAPGQLNRSTPPEPTAGFSVDEAPLPIGGRILVAGIQWGANY